MVGMILLYLYIYMLQQEKEEILRLYPPAGIGHNQQNAANIIAGTFRRRCT